MARTAVVSGVGPGLGAALVRKFAVEGCRVAMFARSLDYLQKLAAEVGEETGSRLLPVAVDITRPEDIAAGFQQVRDELGAVDILVNHASNASWKGLLDLTPDEFDLAWRVSVFGAFLCSRQSVPDMLGQGGGAIIFTGATSGVRGRAGALAFSSAKFGVRGLADSMAREFWPQGIHVAHVVIDGLIDTPRVRADFGLADQEPALAPGAIAESYWNLIQQDPSSWSFEIDVRPAGEAFFD